MGSGDAAENNQTFIIKKDNISFISDTHLEWGVRADIEIIVNDRRYEQVSTFDESGPGDAHYTITLIENGYLKITFGDGKQARRLPSGYNNVSMTYRIGSGSLGNNVVRNSLNTLIKSDIRTISVRQPFATSGGEDAESSQQLRKNAPRHLQSLGRAISLSDFEYIAETTSGVWHAKAFQNSAISRRQSISIVIVPANDAPLGQLSESLSGRLKAVSSPSTDFIIRRFEPVPLILSISIRVDSTNFDTRTIEARLRSEIYKHLQLRNRRPGASLYASELYKIIESQSGIVNSDLHLFKDIDDASILSESNKPLRAISRARGASIASLTPTPDQVIYLRSESTIGIFISEAVL